MMVALFLSFVLIAGCCEYYIWRLLQKRGECSLFRWLYGGITAAVWALTALCIIRFVSLADAGSAFTRFCGVALIVFLFNGIAKMVYAVMACIGMLTGKRGVAGTISWIVIILLAGVTLYGATAGRSHIRIEKETFVSPRVPPAFDGFRIALFSDVHTGLLIGRDRVLKELVETVNSLNADMAVNCGDIVNYDYRELDEDVLDILGGIKSRYGVYAVPGNHDLGIYIRDTVRYNPAESLQKIEAAQKSLGWSVLRDTSVLLVEGCDTISVTGLDFPVGLIRRSHARAAGTADISAVYREIPSSVFNITLSHAPQMWDAVKGAGRGDVTLSGHVHSLQMKISAGGWQWSPAAWFYDRWSGAYRDGCRLLYINDGIGYAMIPMRIGTRPEVTLITLRRSE